MGRPSEPLTGFYAVARFDDDTCKTTLKETLKQARRWVADQKRRTGGARIMATSIDGPDEVCIDRWERVPEDDGLPDVEDADEEYVGIDRKASDLDVCGCGMHDCMHCLSDEAR